MLAVRGAAQTQPERSPLAAMGKGCTFVPGLLEGQLGHWQGNGAMVCREMVPTLVCRLPVAVIFPSEHNAVLRNQRAWLYVGGPGGFCPSCQVVGTVSPLTRLPQSQAAGYCHLLSLWSKG